jgi:hypothetical protein
LDEAAMRQTNGVPSHRLEVNHWPACIAIFCQKRSCFGVKSVTNEANFLGSPNRWIRPCCIFFNIKVVCAYWMFPIPLDLYLELFFWGYFFEKNAALSPNIIILPSTQFL